MAAASPGFNLAVLASWAAVARSSWPAPSAGSERVGNYHRCHDRRRHRRPPGHDGAIRRGAALAAWHLLRQPGGSDGHRCHRRPGPGDGSGLGCPTWPQCTEGSLVPTATQSEAWHKYVEFGNRTLTFVLGILAIAALVGAIAWRDACGATILPADVR